MKLAFFSPVNPVKSGISDYSESLLAALAAKAEVQVDLFVDGYEPSAEWIRERVRVVDCRATDVAGSLKAYDAVVYQMGGTPSHHQYIYEMMQRHPGVVVLHDLMYQGFFYELLVKKGRTDEYRRVMEEGYGADGGRVASEILSGKQVPFDELRRFPLNKKMIAVSRGIIVHSEGARKEVTRTHPSATCQLIPHHDFGWTSRPDDGQHAMMERRTAARRRLGLPLDAPICGSFGLIVPTKRIEVTLRAFAEVRSRMPTARYYLVGAPKYHVAEYIRFLGIDDAVTVTGHVTLDDFEDYLHAVDVCLNLRYPSQGETSGALLRMLALGKPVVVTNHGWFSELPEKVCGKVDPADLEDEEVAEFLYALFSDVPYRNQMGKNARSYVEEHCALSKVTDQYLEFLARAA
jgi:glycosyltransferase involved in cell wall biosynthesis